VCIVLRLDKQCQTLLAMRTMIVAELKMLRTLNDISVSEDDRSLSASSNRRRVSSINQSAAYHHDTDIIFALPKLQLDFKTEHLQGPEEPNPDGERDHRCPKT